MLPGLERPSTRLKLTRTRYTFSLIKEQVPGPKLGSEDASSCVWRGLIFLRCDLQYTKACRRLSSTVCGLTGSSRTAPWVCPRTIAWRLASSRCYAARRREVPVGALFEEVSTKILYGLTGEARAAVTKTVTGGLVRRNRHRCKERYPPAHRLAD